MQPASKLLTLFFLILMGTELTQVGFALASSSQPPPQPNPSPPFSPQRHFLLNLGSANKKNLSPSSRGLQPLVPPPFCCSPCPGCTCSGAGVGGGQGGGIGTGVWGGEERGCTGWGRGRGGLPQPPWGTRGPSVPPRSPTRVCGSGGAPWPLAACGLVKFGAACPVSPHVPAMSPRGCAGSAPW